ncbi:MULTISPECIES: cell division protein FtsA [Bacillus]|uniref:cell division protein FtsA n=1 Tax=Bacillus TaxID=1386 RepID=UPI0002E97F5A|nr:MULTISPECIES: cell division protein FtsA [Bacillus]
MQEKLFALDIGTRSVVGIIIEKNEDSFRVTDITSKEHTERAMLDGQIHDVLAVSKVIKEIKTEMEKRHGELKNVSVAAAGRALKTERALVSVNIQGKPMINKDDILHLELSAVQQAQIQIAEKHASDKTFDYYCVGYSILYYRLDGTEIGSLIDQNGEEASVEIIATFLPKVVVESLISALKRADLEMQALTLEPIAAINVLIPQSMRRLNVALIDIGAGTSDIAITDTGTVIAYGMVPVAGDEITEAISDQLLLDFPLAEQAKRQLNNQESIKVTDILGFEDDVPSSEVIEKIKPTLIKLAESISSEILNLNNNKPPKAVMLVGGGSLTPQLPSLIAEQLQMTSNRVAVRGIDAIQNLTIDTDVQQGPELVTPIGIALAAQKNPVHYITVKVNEMPVRLFNMKKLTVGDCLLASGIKVNKLYGKPGMAKMVNVNGQTITIPGIHGRPPILLLNNQPTSIDDTINENDEIFVEKGNDGTSSDVLIKDLLDDIPRKTVIINQTKYVIEAVIKKNGVVVNSEEVVDDRDELICKLPETIESLIKALNLHQLLNQLQPFTIYLNDKAYSFNKYSGRITKNGLDVALSSSFEDGDIIQIESSTTPTLGDVADSLNIKLHHSIPVSFNGNIVTLSKNVTEFYRYKQLLQEKDPLKYGEKLKIVQNKVEPFIFQDLFRYVNIDLPKVANGRFIIIKNNKEVGFHEELNPGDDLRIMWPTTSNKANLNASAHREN